MKRLLSTKQLNLAQKELLLNAGCSFVDYNAIEIIPLKFDFPNKIDNAIFTSGNAVDIVFENKPENLQIKKTYCVGPKTATKLTEFGQNVVKTAKNASELADFIDKTFENEDFYFFSGTLRKSDLPDRLNSSKNQLFELKTYKTELKTRSFNQIFDGILFFSPSGVDSFTQQNKTGSAAVICIGETTASEARKYTPNVHVANQTTIESVIAKAVKILRTND
ncbi:uroporphyrinogen-III synthase [Aureitalea sp. L0-47]|uniref:uroporphyrinogen-III synthase n=1 Tax=Aureitalea sp. L0-47 TaxID=2816962 RepID=UPI00223701E5|nr:uroporphyrinogen-III synthase [Aureitalea sp. L0-47]MCW5518211.1 uroporphyrinogen-III synthase [Aureitalea sp. L0-47]